MAMLLVHSVINAFLHLLKIFCFSRKQPCRLMRHSLTAAHEELVTCDEFTFSPKSELVTKTVTG